jgi:hypothetical protein
MKKLCAMPIYNPVLLLGHPGRYLYRVYLNAWTNFRSVPLTKTGKRSSYQYMPATLGF